MAEVHLVVGAALIALSLTAFAAGGVAWLRSSPSLPFWYLLRAAQAAVFAQAMLGGLLVLLGHEPSDKLHYLYGVLPLVVSFLAEGARTSAAARELGGADFGTLPGEEQRALALAIVRRETGIMAIGCGVIFLLALRAAMTSGGL